MSLFQSFAVVSTFGSPKQVAALQWVQKEIRAMGGDATRVALMARGEV